MSAEAVVIAVSEYADYPLLPEAAGVARRLAESLGQAGYRFRDKPLLEGGDASSVGLALDDWLRKAEAGATLVLFWTGHGHAQGDGHYLVCKGSPKAGLSSVNALPASTIGAMIAQSRAEKILVVFDTCFSGGAAADAAQAFSTIVSTCPPVPGRSRAISVIASAHPLEKAEEAVFANAFLDVLFEPGATSLWSDEEQLLRADDIAVAVKNALEAVGYTPNISCDEKGLGKQFVPNPRFRRGVGADDVETRRKHAAAFDGLPHFELASKGIEVGETGWYFTGRIRLLKELVGWLKTADRGLAIVTGPPGTGKSAVIGRLVTLSTRECREAAEKIGVLGSALEGTVPPAGIIDVAIHAKGKTLDDCVRVLARGLQLDLTDGVLVDVDAVIQQVASLDRRIAVVVDALDEASSGHGARIAQELIVPISKLPKARILVGTRRSLEGAVVPEGDDRHARLRQALGDQAIIHDLADEAETKEDIADYARLRLSASRHGDDRQAIDEAARTIAERSQDIFLYARVVSRTLQSQERLDVKDLPESAIGAFVEDLNHRFEGNRTRVDELLSALAFGMGKGLSRRVWAPIATALSRAGSRYTDADVEWVLNTAGSHIVETGKETSNVTQAVYRLVHQAFTDHYQAELKARMDESEAHRLIAEAMTEGIKGADWLDADRYLWRHLADHAAIAGNLDDFVIDAGYLAVAEPIALTQALHTIRDDHAREIADIYRRTADRLIDRDPVDRMPYIHLMAEMEAPALARQLEPLVATKWRCRWARCVSTISHRVIGRHPDEVIAIAFVMIQRTPILISADKGGLVQIRSARTGELFGDPIAAGQYPRLCAGVVADRPVVSVASGQMLQTFELPTGRAHWDRNAELEKITALTVATVDDRSILVSGGFDQYVRSRDLMDRTLLWQRQLARNVTSVASTAIGSGSLILVGAKGQNLYLLDARNGTDVLRNASLPAPSAPPLSPAEREKYPWADQSFMEAFYGSDVACWSYEEDVILAAGRGFGIDLWKNKPSIPEHRNNKNSIAQSVLQLAYRILAAVTGSSVESGNGKPRISSDDIVESAYRKTATLRHSGTVECLAFVTASSQALLASGGKDKTVHIWDANTGEPIGPALVGHSGTVRSVAWGTVDGDLVIFSGGNDGAVLAWNYDVVSRTEPIAQTTDVYGATAISLCKIDDSLVILVGTDDGRIIVVDSNSSKTLTTVHCHSTAIDAIFTYIDKGKMVVVAHASKGRAAEFKWSHNVASTILRTAPVSAIAAAKIGTRPYVISAIEYELKMVDDQLAFASLEFLDPYEDRFGLPQRTFEQPRKGQEGARIFATLGGSIETIALVRFNSESIVLASTTTGVVKAWNADNGFPRFGILDIQSNRGRMAFGDLAGRLIVVSPGYDGDVNVLDIVSGELVHKLSRGGQAEVSYCVVTKVEGRDLVIFADKVGDVVFWDPLVNRILHVVSSGLQITGLSISTDGGLAIATARGIIFVNNSVDLG
ncbi:WD40 repeat domain-containing protein [Mesorhizobium sp. M0816]|uniref:WD40 repeat domain-containing protein n=1 Tax=Mesorhizobium sp. M0816 TaxID=2957006 RepID=UPI003335864C